MTIAILVLAAALGMSQSNSPQAGGASSLGRVAMLVARSDPEYRAQLRTAIGGLSPAIRTVAARVAAVRGQRDMRAPLEDAMARETDETAKKEQARALAVLMGPSDAILLDRSAPAAVRTPSILVPGLLASLVAETKCKPGAASFGVAHVFFDGTGVGARSEIDPRQLTTDCGEVLKIIAMLAMPDESATTIPAAGEYLLLPLDKEFVACSSLAQSKGDRPAGKVTAPRKTHDVRPDPVVVRGEVVVVVTALISDTGCVQYAKVDRPRELSADLSALRAVTGWRYEPARVGTTPVWTAMVMRVIFGGR